jgi:hypothetical protein
MLVCGKCCKPGRAKWGEHRPIDHKERNPTLGMRDAAEREGVGNMICLYSRSALRFRRARASAIVMRVSRAAIYRIVFVLAGLYNIGFGLWAALFPHTLFDLLDLGKPSHPGIWACLGMIVGLYGLIYLQVAFTDEQQRKSALVIAGCIEYDFTRFLIGIGLAGKILGPIGFVLSLHNGELPLRMIPLVALDDLVWWVPFAMYLIDGTVIANALARNAPRICSVVHIVAAIATVLWIREGSEANRDPILRAGFIASHTTAWRIAWFIWMVGAASLGGFFCWWAARSPKRQLARNALIVGFAGILGDFLSDSLLIGWLPEHYAAYVLPMSVLSQVVANGLYSVAGALLMLASGYMPSWFRAWGWVVWISGFALAAAGTLRWDAAIVVSSAVLMTTFIPWVWFANRFLDKPL